jgi:GntR family transcriptional regulator, transcriptional repressor for pyruvate dehydrogenase complex
MDQKDVFKPIKGKRAFEEVSFQIKNLVFQGVLNPGDKLPTETDLAGRFNVSRQTIREALRILELSGFIEVLKGYGGGSFVKDTMVSKMSNLFMDSIRLENITMEEMTVARLEIERVILNYAMDCADDIDIENLQKNIASAKLDLQQNNMATAANLEFHKIMAKASKNQVLVILMELILVALGHLLAKRPPDIETTASAIRYHEKILEAMINKDHAKALKLLEAHLTQVEEQLTALPYDLESSFSNF